MAPGVIPLHSTGRGEDIILETHCKKQLSRFIKQVGHKHTSCELRFLYKAFPPLLHKRVESQEVGQPSGVKIIPTWQKHLLPLLLFIIALCFSVQWFPSASSPFLFQWGCSSSRMPSGPQPSPTRLSCKLVWPSSPVRAEPLEGQKSGTGDILLHIWILRSFVKKTCPSQALIISEGK